jgi:hypothetical protein
MGRSIGLLAIAFGCGLSAGAEAAPQVLAVVATYQPVELTCAHGQCSAELTAICLQPDRASPAAGKRYVLADAGGLRIIGLTRAGARRALPFSGLATVTAFRGHNAVKVSIPGRRLNALGVRRAYVEVGTRVSLIPTPTIDDPRPQTPGDLALATGPLRTVADRLVDHGGVATDTARITRVMLNTLPARGRATEAARHAAWQKAQLSAAAQRAPEALDQARAAFDKCRVASTTGVLTLRSCLGSRHDSLIGGQNNAYWNALKAGS